MCTCIARIIFLHLCRFDFVPCNRLDHYVIEIHVKAGQASEIYADRENKVRSLKHALFQPIIVILLIYRCG